jgi:polyribonucleotide nucleotidyltransferase
MKAPCAGIAMGLVVEGSNYSILTDCRRRDHYGDMDSKLPVRAKRHRAADGHQDASISIGMMREALAQAKESSRRNPRHHGKDAQRTAKMFALRAAHHAVEVPTERSAILSVRRQEDRSIIEQTGVKIDVLEDGTVIFSTSGAEAISRASSSRCHRGAEIAKPIRRGRLLGGIGAFSNSSQAPRLAPHQQSPNTASATFAMS